MLIRMNRIRCVLLFERITVCPPTSGCTTSKSPFCKVAERDRTLLTSRGHMIDVLIFNVYRAIGVGFCEEHAPLDRMLGWGEESWGYHGDDGKIFHDAPYGKSYGPTYETGDTIGCGVNFKDETAFFSKNGSVIGKSKGSRTGPPYLT